MGKKSYNKHKGSGRKNHKKPRIEKKNDFNKSVVTGISRRINGFKDLRELNDIDDPHFADEGGFAYQIAYQFSSFGEPINTNQLRKIFGEIKAIEREGTWEKAELNFNLLKPKFAISVSRKVNDQPLIHIEFYKLIKTVMNKVKVDGKPEISFNNLKIFSQFFEAIVAYHKLHNKNYELNEKIKKNLRNKNKNKSQKNKSKSKKKSNKKKIDYMDIFNEEIIKMNRSNFDYNSFKEICDEISSFSSLDELNQINEKFDKPSYEDEEGYADIIAKDFSQIKGKKINSNQIRRFYNEIKSIERYGNWEDAKTEFYLFKPRLAISVTRESSCANLIPYEFYYLIKITMDKVYVKNNPELSFNNLRLFVNFFEAIVGFHKFYSL